MINRLREKYNNVNCLLWQATAKNDIRLPADIPQLLLEKHAQYLVSYSINKDDYVSMLMA